MTDEETSKKQKASDEVSEKEDKSEDVIIAEEPEEELDEPLRALKEIDEEEIDEETLHREQGKEEIGRVLYAIRYLDAVSELPRFSTEKLYSQFESNYILPYAEINQEFATKWQNIEPDILTLISKGEDLARAKGGLFKMSYRKASLIILAPVIAVVLISMLIFSAMSFLIPSFGTVSLFFMMIPLFVFCCGQSYIDRYLRSFWEKKRAEITPKFKEICEPEIERVKSTIQDFLYMANALLEDYQIPPAETRFILFNPEYNGITVISEQPEKHYKSYIVQLLS
ncbi:MAG: hypothetical protein ACTSRW_00600 [Candidatus Helarchaeota archaeon]